MFLVSYITKAKGCSFKPTKNCSILTEWNEIISACRRGDHVAQCEAYHRSWKIIFPSVYHVLRNKEEAEDVLQESMIKGFERLNELKDANRYVSWQKKIALNDSLNRLRERKSFTPFFDHSDVSVPEEDDGAVVNMDITRVHSTIETMPEGYRLVIRLHLMEELTHEEIGKALGISASTSRSQYSRAMSKLRKELSEEYERQF